MPVRAAKVNFLKQLLKECVFHIWATSSISSSISSSLSSSISIGSTRATERVALDDTDHKDIQWNRLRVQDVIQTFTPSKEAFF